ncbi:hypothetical protein OHT76_00290 [Streptomyces sp. NBC_00287]|nr:hypothetical protein [Streptomyces sp. NBC_00287]
MLGLLGLGDRLPGGGVVHQPGGDRRTAQDIARHRDGHVLVDGQVLDALHLLLHRPWPVRAPADMLLGQVRRPAPQPGHVVDRRLVDRLEPLCIVLDRRQDRVDLVRDALTALAGRPTVGREPVVEDRWRLPREDRLANPRACM